MAIVRSVRSVTSTRASSWLLAGIGSGVTPVTSAKFLIVAGPAPTSTVVLMTIGGAEDGVGGAGGTGMPGIVAPYLHVTMPPTAERSCVQLHAPVTTVETKLTLSGNVSVITIGSVAVPTLSDGPRS